MRKKEFELLHKQVYAVCLGYRLTEALEIGKIKLMLNKNRGDEYILERLEEGEGGPYEPENPFYRGEDEFLTRVLIDTDQFVSEYIKHTKEEEFLEWVECIEEQNEEKTEEKSGSGRRTRTKLEAELLVAKKDLRLLTENFKKSKGE